MNMFKPTTAKSPEDYISQIDEPRKSDIQKIHDYIQKIVPQFKPYMEGNIISYGKYHYKSKSGREGDWMVIGLASQKNYISIYICAADGEKYVPEKYKKQIPKASIGRSCVRIKKAEDIEFSILKKMILEGVKVMKSQIIS